MPGKKQEPTRVLVIAAHPDDPEYGCAGTVAKWASAGMEVSYLLLTSGDKGSKDPEVRPGALATLREKEQRSAAAVLGVKEVLFQRHPDGLLENSLALRREIVGIIRRLRPNRVLAIDPWKRYQTHPDHRASGMAAMDAVYAAKQVYLFPEQLMDGVEPWRVKEVYLFWAEEPDHWEDVSETVGLRIAALRRHASQVAARRQGLAARVRDGARKTAEKSGTGCAYAEGFKLLRF